MHVLNRIAVPWGIATAMLVGAIHHFLPREINLVELIAVALTPLVFPVLVYVVLLMHRDILKTDLDFSPFDPATNPLSIVPVRPINALGAFTRLLAGWTIGLTIVSFLNWPFNLAYAMLYGLTTVSMGLTVAALPKLLNAPSMRQSTELSDDTERALTAQR